jgi:1-acyl-sn-glycerol-3-phosphate acyltransferase
MTAKTGAARIALMTGAPVIPAAQWGPQEVLAPYSKRLRLFPRKTMHVWAGPEVDLDDLRALPVSAATLREATERIMRDITKILATQRDEVPPAVPLDRRTALPKKADS